MTKVSAIITSGGSSIRFGSNKLLEKLGDLTVIETTVLKFIDYLSFQLNLINLFFLFFIINHYFIFLILFLVSISKIKDYILLFLTIY